ncbi:MAG: MotA/TolQ/ExbB proton channel family protein, partial [Pseudomonadales bacterium]
MKDIISAGGWLMLPILACSVLALAIGLERLFSLRTRRVLPAGLFESTQAGLRGGIVGAAGLVELAVSSPRGSVFEA